jgi:Tfp pilus assembly protein PilX
MNKKLFNGQIGLLLLVIMGVIVALVMSIASRSLSDTVVSRQERESSSAFSVAETGVEKAMYDLQNSEGEQSFEGVLSGLSDTVTGNYAVKPSANYGLYAREGETANLDLSTYVPTLTISWTKKTDKSENLTCVGDGSGLSPAAIEIIAITATGVTRSYYNPAGCNPGINGFLNSAIDGGIEYRSQILSYAVPATTTILRIKPIYSGATISVSGSGLNEQLYLIQSKAATGDAQKEIEVKRGLDAAPSIFDFAVFSAQTIVK